MSEITAVPLPQLPEFEPSSDLAGEIVSACNRLELELRNNDVLCVAHTVISKIEGSVVELDSVQPSSEAQRIADKQGKDPRLIQVVLDQSETVLRCTDHVIISRTYHGFVCANAGVDSSNTEPETVLLLPPDPDNSARDLRRAIEKLTNTTPGIVISDSFGRAWRRGQTDIAVGCAGVVLLDDWRGLNDRNGNQLTATEIAVADQLAALADLTRTKNSGEPAVIIRGADRFVVEPDGPGISPILRPASETLFL